MKLDIQKRFRRSHISADDFDRAIEFIREAQNHQPKSLIYDALLISAIIYYARPFGPNEHRKNRDPLSESSIDDTLTGFEDPNEQKLHNEIVILRNKVVAHAEYAPGKYSIDQMSVAPSGQMSIASTIWRASHEWFNLHQFERIATEMRARCYLAITEDVLISYPQARME